MSDPVVCDALFVEGCRQHRAGNLDRAKKLFEQVLVFDPGHVNTLCNLGALELGLGHAERAYVLLQTAIMEAPEFAPARRALADVLMATQKTEQALAQYRKAVELAPASADIHAAYANALRKLGDDEQAGGIHPDVKKRLIHQHFRKAIELAPYNDAMHAGYAIALCEIGDLDAAMTEFLVATKINQNQSAEFYHALGRACAARGNSQGAEVSLNHALVLDPRLVPAHCALGDLYLTLDRSSDAEASFRRALAIDSVNAVALRGIERVATTCSAATVTGTS